MTSNLTSAAQERRPLLAKNSSQPPPLARVEGREGVQESQAEHISLDEAARLAALQALPWYRRPSIYWLLPFAVLLAVVLGISQAPQDQLTIRIVCREHFKGSDIPALHDPSSISMSSVSLLNGGDDPCLTPAVQALAALVMSRLRSLRYVTAIFTVGYYTSLSDRYGRKALIFLTLIPGMLTQVLILYMARPSSTLGIEILYADALFMGLVGAGLLLHPSLVAYVADCTPREGRSLAIGFVMVSLAVGLIIGPIVGGFLIAWTGDVTSAMTMSIIILCVLTVYAVILPESLPKGVGVKPETSADDGPVAVGPSSSTKAEDVSILIRIKNAMLAVFDPLLLFLPGRIDSSQGDVNELPSRYTLVMLVAAHACLQFAITGEAIVLIPYTNLVFYWTTLEDDVYYFVSGAASFIVYIAIFPGLQKLYKIVVEKQRLRTPSGTSAIQNPSPYQEHSEISQLLDVNMGNFEGEMIEEALRPEARLSTDAAATRAKTMWNDLTFFIFGGAVFVIGYLIVPIFETEASLLIACCVRALASVALPSFASLLTSYVPVHLTGRAFGGLCVLDTILMTISSLTYGWVFAKTSSTMPSASFLMSAAVTSLSILGGLMVWNIYTRSEAKKRIFL